MTRTIGLSMLFLLLQCYSRSIRPPYHQTISLLPFEAFYFIGKWNSEPRNFEPEIRAFISIDSAVIRIRLPYSIQNQSDEYFITDILKPFKGKICRKADLYPCKITGQSMYHTTGCLSCVKDTILTIGYRGRFSSLFIDHKNLTCSLFDSLNSYYHTVTICKLPEDEKSLYSIFYSQQ